ncbi:MAG: integral membrane sensor protein [Meiothermus sp.]|uniref:MHYT domain-containing protein n=1 Tax=Meiothermus sp. TaxID=1955249 RepID=UPI002624ECA3|nr:MHYT domain-containing protein [Meiothermus sp.]MCS7057903.1 integral membrane sensor protein [Meiothermus sp.]MDW8480732.1 MHYT domain-containing protein [Meiothermus sp.]
MEQNHLPMHHDPLLVGTSFFIAIFASYAALVVIRRLRQGNRSPLWLWMGAFTYGMGVWAMHFTAMTALRLENLLVSYDPLLTLVSVLLAILGAAAAFQMVRRPKVGGLGVLGAGFFLGTGIGAMHYTGMLAMQLDAKLSFNPPLVALSLLVAIALGTFGMWTLTSPAFDRVPLRNLLTATLTGLAIPLMHYTAMLAVRFTPNPDTPHAQVVLQGLLSLNLFILLAVALSALPLFAGFLLDSASDHGLEVET